MRTAARGPCSTETGARCCRWKDSPTTEVDVWLVTLDVAAHRRAFLEGLLSPDERERADRYRLPAPRARFVVTRGTLRLILSQHTSAAPHELRFSYPCVCGKPDCVPSRRKPRLDPDSPKFNVTHTDGLAMVAVSTTREVGIDLERIDQSRPTDPVAERILTADERAGLRALPESRRSEAFYRAWTRKEAYGKARGDGVALSSRTDDLDGWSLYDLQAPPGYVASLAVADGPCTVRTSWWRPMD